MNENTSGRGAGAAVPHEVDRWNWGAFLLNWIWGLGNSTYIALLCLVPFVNLVMVFVLGAKGSAWAWRNKRWGSVEEFKRIQKYWALGALAAYGLLIAFVAGIFFFVMAMMKGSDAYLLGMAKLQAHGQAMEILGPPISTGFVTGSVRTTGPGGEAELSFSVKGQKARGTLYLEATKRRGSWNADVIELEIEGRPNRIDLNR